VRTYYKTVTPADLSKSGKTEIRISAVTPSSGNPSKTAYLRGGDKVYALRAGTIAEAKAADPKEWERRESLEL